MLPHYSSLGSMKTQDSDKEKHNPKRVILLFADDRNNRDLQKQTELLQPEEADLRERHLEVYVVLSDDVENLKGENMDKLNASGMRQDYEVRPDEFRLLLIGKDRTVKMNESYPVESKAIFDKIDAMPMRQREMKNR